MSNDLELIEQTLNGQTEAFGQLVLKYQDRLYNTVFHVVNHVDDAKDVVQEAFVHAFLKLNTFRRECEFFTWLYRIAFNTAVTRLRQQRQVGSLDNIRMITKREPVDQHPLPTTNLERKELCQAVHKAMAQLDDDFRAVLVLREIEGCSYEEISQILDLPIGTVRSRLHRARMQLREILMTTTDLVAKIEHT